MILKLTEITEGSCLVDTTNIFIQPSIVKEGGTYIGTPIRDFIVLETIEEIEQQIKEGGITNVN